MTATGHRRGHLRLPVRHRRSQGQHGPGRLPRRTGYRKRRDLDHHRPQHRPIPGSALAAALPLSPDCPWDLATVLTAALPTCAPNSTPLEEAQHRPSSRWPNCPLGCWPPLRRIFACSAWRPGVASRHGNAACRRGGGAHAGAAASSSGQERPANPINDLCIAAIVASRMLPRRHRARISPASP